MCTASAKYDSPLISCLKKYLPALNRLMMMCIDGGSLLLRCVRLSCILKSLSSSVPLFESDILTVRVRFQAMTECQRGQVHVCATDFEGGRGVCVVQLGRAKLSSLTAIFHLVFDVDTSAAQYLGTRMCHKMCVVPHGVSSFTCSVSILSRLPTNRGLCCPVGLLLSKHGGFCADKCIYLCVWITLYL